MNALAKSFEFRRRADDPVRYTVTSNHLIGEYAARLAFEEYVSKHVIVADEPRDVTIRFQEWFPGARAVQTKIPEDGESRQ